MRFLCVGGSAAGIYFAIVHTLTIWVKLPVMLSISVGYICSVVFHFLVNRRYTFGQKGNWSVTELLRYMTVAVLNYVLTVVVVSLLTQNTTIGLNLVVACAILTTTSFGFLASRYWIFRSSRSCHE
ncbi:GtrA family protein [Polynucleobacter rarus]|uniref:GtrA family protein n=1 Tax=Polynucleobacter rarus TaxID=556055 RepID=UPI00131EF6E3